MYMTTTRMAIIRIITPTITSQLNKHFNPTTDITYHSVRPLGKY